MQISGVSLKKQSKLTGGRNGGPSIRCFNDSSTFSHTIFAVYKAIGPIASVSFTMFNAIADRDFAAIDTWIFAFWEGFRILNEPSKIDASNLFRADLIALLIRTLLQSTSQFLAH